MMTLLVFLILMIMGDAVGASFTVSLLVSSVSIIVGSYIVSAISTVFRNPRK